MIALRSSPDDIASLPASQERRELPFCVDRFPFSIREDTSAVARYALCVMIGAASLRYAFRGTNHAVWFPMEGTVESPRV
jgi:hypothetical protein